MRINRWILSLAISVVATWAVAAPNSLYFMDILPYRTYQNPALRPLSDSYVELPGLSTISVSAGAGGLSLNDLMYVKDGQLVTFLHPEYGNKDALFAKLRKTNRVTADADVSLFGFGFKINEKAYLSFNLSTRVDALVGVPKDLFSLALYGTPDTLGVNSYDLSSLSVNARSYFDFSVGYLHQINEKWSVGGRLHILTGALAARMYNDELCLEASSEQWKLKGNSLLQVSVPGLGVVLDEDGHIKELTTSDFVDMLAAYRPSMGAAIDLGVEYKPLPSLSISLSLKDIGFMYWNNVLTATSTAEGEYDGVYFQQDEPLNIVDSLSAAFKSSLLYDGKRTNYVQEMRGKLYVGAEYSFLRNMMSVGVLSKTEFMSNYISEEISLNYKIRPCHWFGISAGYSFVSGGWSTIGFGMDIKLPPFNFYVATDYTPLFYSVEGIPYRSQAFNVQAGIVLTFKTKNNVKKLTAKAQDLAEIPVTDSLEVAADSLPIEMKPVLQDSLSVASSDTILISTTTDTINDVPLAEVGGTNMLPLSDAKKEE